MNNVGGIEYDVVANTGELLKAEQETQRSVKNIDGSMKKLGASSAQVDKVTKSVGELGKEADSSGFALSRMQKALLGAFTVSSALTIGKIADDYRTLTERVRFATESQEEYDIVQKRLIQSANESYRSLQEASEVFIGTSDNLRSLGFSLDEALDIADSLSFSFVKNATATDRARNAINAYDNALNRGVVSTLDWRTINNAIPTLAQDIAKSLGKTTDEILKMGNAGEIAASLLNETLLETFDANREAATGMATTIEDAFVKLRTNLSVFVGEANKTVGATDLVASAIDVVAENIQTLATLMLAAGAGAAARYATQFGLVTVAKMKDAMATRAAIAEELRLAQANLAAAQAEVKRTAAIVAKGGAHAKNTIALNNETVATARLAAAQQAAAVTARSFLALLGGPAGIVGLLTVGVTAFSMFTDAAKDTGEALEDLKDPIDVLLDRFEKLNAEQKKLALIKYDEARVEMLKKEARAAEDVYGYLVKMNTARYKEAQGRDIAIYKMHEYKQAIDEAINSGGDIIDTIEKIAKETNMSTADTKAFIEAASGYTGARDLVAQMAEKLGILAKSADDAKVAVEGLTAAQREQATINEGFTGSFDGITKSLIKQKNTLEDAGSAVAIYTRQYNEAIAANTSVTADGVKVVAELTAEQQLQHEENLKIAKAIDNERESRKTSNKEIQASNNVLKDLQNELYLATLSGKELAIVRAEQRLNEFATQQEVQAVRDLAAALYDLQTIGGTKEDQDEYIEGDTGRLTGGAFDDQIARYEEEAELERQRYADQLERLMQARETQLQTEDEYNQKEFELREKHNERMGRIEQAKNSVRLKSYSESASAIASVLANSNAEQSGFYKAAFAIAKGFAIADATMNAYDAISKAWASAPFPANLGAVAATTPAVMGVISSIQGTNYGGGRQYGGPVSAGSMYRINETGESEIFNAGGGKQYFIPNENGKVVPAKDVGGGGSSKVTVNLIEDSSRGGTIEDQSTNEEAILNVFVADIRSGGSASQTFEATYGLTRQGL